ncbi:flagellar basal body P-ring protein FlgI [Undibacterium sp. Di27W]|uniref:flagellar basal body P-ring protein FlgI n=1 Tax=Undibacterium sp. Di27W TaxID=3413036 RepID=UPI003BF4454C
MRIQNMIYLLQILLLSTFIIAQDAQAINQNKANEVHDLKEVRVKDIGKLQGWRENALVGYGIVTGLAGTGDSSSNRTTRQVLANVYSQFNLTIPVDQVQSRNVAVVMVSAMLPAFSREGDTLDITITSAGDARSLVGGSLLSTPLKAPNGRVYALAQGALSVGGYRYDANGNIIQKNHPTVGSVPNGAIVEVGVSSQMLNKDQKLTFLLSDPDYTTASRVAKAINAKFGMIAVASDASGIQIQVADNQKDQLVDFIAEIENVLVEPDRRAKVVINERTGVVVAGGDVQISRVSISHGDIKISVASQNTASQPFVIGQASSAIRTAIVTNTKLDVDEKKESAFLSEGNTVADLVRSLVRIKTNTRDIISILRAVKAAGALHAELIIQ